MTLRDGAGVDRDHPGFLVRRLDAIELTPSGRDRPSDRPTIRPELIWAYINWPFDWMDGEPPGDGSDKDCRWLFSRHKEYLRERHKEYLLGTEPPDLTLGDLDLSILELTRRLKRDLILQPAVPIPSGSGRHAIEAPTPPSVDATPDPLRLDDKAVALYTRWMKEGHSGISKRSLARALKCHPSSLRDCPTFQTLWMASQGELRTGYRNARTGDIEADDED
jgi:hypothetical protein